MSPQAIPEPEQNYAKPELQHLLDLGIEPLKQWIRDDVAKSHPASRFHATSQWDDNVLACYLAKFLPHLPPTYYYVQDVIVIHLPQYWQNDCYNRIYTQLAGNCPIPDVFHHFLLDLTRSFGDRRLSAQELLYWLEHGKAPQEVQHEEVLLQDERFVRSITQVETQLGGTVDRSTFRVLVEFGTLEWMGMVVFKHDNHEMRTKVYVRGDLILPLDRSQAEKMAEWLDEMCARGYVSPWK